MKAVAKDALQLEIVQNSPKVKLQFIILINLVKCNVNENTINNLLTT